MNRKTKTKLLLVSLAVSSAATLNVYAGGGDEDQAMGDCAQAAAAATTSAPRALFDIACGDSVNLDEFKNTLRGFGNYANRLSKLNEQDDKGNTVLHIAVLCGHLELAKFILRNYDVNLSLRNSDGKTVSNIADEAMITAIAAGAAAGKNSGVPDPLQKEGAPKFDRIPYLSEPAFRAVRIKEMIINFSKIRELVRNNHYRYTDMAVLKPHITQDTADIIINGHTLLELAIVHNDTEMVEFLLTNHASANALIMRGGKAMTPFRLAIQNGNTDLVKCLLEHGADANLDNPLFYALNSQSISRKIVELLVEKGASANAQVMHEGEILTPLKLAIKKGDTNLVKYLLEHGADVNLGNPLSYALHLCHDKSHKDLNMLRLLLDHGADLNSVKNDEFEKAIKKICPYGSTAELNRQSDESGNTIFHLVVKCGHFELTKFLLENYDFDQQLKNNESLTVLDVARRARDNAVKPDEAVRFEEMVCDFANIRNLLRINKEVTGEILKYITKDTVGITLGRRSLFEIFVEQGNLEAVKTCIDKGFNVGMFDQQYADDVGIVSLAIVRSQNVEMAKFLVENGADINEPAKFLFDGVIGFQTLTPLECAIRNRDLDLVKYLILHKADVNVGSPLCYAIECYYNSSDAISYEIVNLLLENGAKFGDETRRPHELLKHALEHKNFNIIRLLVNYGIDSSCVKYYAPIVHKIIEEQRLDLDLLKLLLESNAKLCDEIFDHKTPLTTAISHGKTDAVRLLLEYGADPNKIDGYGRAPLVLAAFRVNPEIVEIVELLLQKNADPNIRGVDRLTPLNQAVRKLKAERAQIDDSDYENYMCVILNLLNHGANIYIEDMFGNTPVEYAIHAKDIKLVNLFLRRHGASMEFESETRKSLLHLALREKCDFQIIKTLVQSGAKPAMREPKQGFTVLHEAVQSGNYDLVEYIINNGGKRVINSQDNQFKATPLHIAVDCAYNIIVKSVQKALGLPSPKESASYVNSLRNTSVDKGLSIIENYLKQTGDIKAYKGYLQIASLLMENGADINLKNRYHLTPLACTMYKNNPGFFKKLCNLRFVDNSKMFQAVMNGNDTEVEHLITECRADARCSPAIDIQTLLYMVLCTTNNMIRNSLKTHIHPAYLHFFNTPGNVPIPPTNTVTTHGLVMLLLNQTGKIDLYRRYIRIAELLIRCGANVNERHENRSLIEIAQANHNISFIELLSNNGAR